MRCCSSLWFAEVCITIQYPFARQKACMLVISRKTTWSTSSLLSARYPFQTTQIALNQPIESSRISLLQDVEWRKPPRKLTMPCEIAWIQRNHCYRDPMITMVLGLDKSTGVARSSHEAGEKNIKPSKTVASMGNRRLHGIRNKRAK